MGVGICSAGYHMTLKYHTQMCRPVLTIRLLNLVLSSTNYLADELSMHLLTTPLIYRLLTFKADQQRTKLVGLVLSILFTIVMVTHMVMDEFLLHASTFGLGVYLISSRLLKIIPSQVPDLRVRQTVRNITWLGLC